MHYVHRGPEPEGLRRIRDRHTQAWVDYYRLGVGTKPFDTHWRRFNPDVERAFRGLCAYCEEECKGEVDHFRPKSRFPERVYEWANWVFSCHDCNHMKGEKWPPRGYIDPCARSLRQRPEEFFEFDTLTGEILPKAGLSRTRRTRAKRMIADLMLNAHHHLRKRRWWIKTLTELLRHYDSQDSGHQRFLTVAASRRAPLSSVTRVLLSEMSYSW